MLCASATSSSTISVLAAAIAFAKWFETVRRVTGHPIPARDVARRPGDPAVLVAGSGSIQRDLHWQPQFPALESIVRSAWEWRRAHPDGYATQLLFDHRRRFGWRNEEKQWDP